jgi:hypothetical protein
MNIYGKIFEGMSPVVFHSTFGMSGIEKHNSIFASSPENALEGPFISFSRSITGSYNKIGIINIILEMDGNKLSSTLSGRSHVFQGAKDFRGELEDRLRVPSGVLRSVNKYITRILVYSDMELLTRRANRYNLENFKKNINSAIRYSQNFNIPIFFIDKLSLYKLKNIGILENIIEAALEAVSDEPLNPPVWNDPEGDTRDYIKNILQTINLFKLGWYSDKNSIGFDIYDFEEKSFLYQEYDLDDIKFAKKEPKLMALINWLWGILKEDGIKKESLDLAIEEKFEEFENPGLENIYYIENKEVTLDEISKTTKIPSYVWEAFS